MRASELIIGLAATAGGRAMAGAVGRQAADISGKAVTSSPAVPYAAGALVGGAGGIALADATAEQTDNLVPVGAAATGLFATPLLAAGAQMTHGPMQALLRAGMAAAPAVALAGLGTMVAQSYDHKGIDDAAR